MLDIVFEKAGPFELLNPHLAQSARFYIWKSAFLELLDRWALCRSDKLSLEAVRSRESSWKQELNIVCLFLIASAILLI